MAGPLRVYDEGSGFSLEVDRAHAMRLQIVEWVMWLAATACLAFVSWRYLGGGRIDLTLIGAAGLLGGFALMMPRPIAARAVFDFNAGEVTLERQDRRGSEKRVVPLSELASIGLAGTASVDGSDRRDDDERFSLELRLRDGSSFVVATELDRRPENDKRIDFVSRRAGIARLDGAGDGGTMAGA